MNPTFRKQKNFFAPCWKTFCHITPFHRNFLKPKCKIFPYRYGVKGFISSMIETSLRVSNNTLNTAIIEKAFQYGKDLIDKPIEMLEGVEAVL